MRTCSILFAAAFLSFLAIAAAAQSPMQMPPLPTTDAPDWISFPSVSNSPDFTVSWDASTTPDSGYSLWMDTKQDFSSAQMIYEGGNLSYNCAEFANGTYYFKVRASSKDLYPSFECVGDHALYVDASLPAPPSEPAAPSGLTVPSTSGPAFTVAWNRHAGNVCYQLKQEYMARYPIGYPSPGFPYSSIVSMIYDGSNNSCFISPVDCDDSWYRFRVRAYVMFFGHPVFGSWSDWSAQVTVNDVPPGPPFMFSVSGSSSGGTVTLSISAGNGAVSYEFEEDYRADFANPVQVYPSISPGPQPIGWGSYVLSGKTDGMYFYRVRSVNSFGASDWRPAYGPAVITGCPAPNPPAVPGSLTVSQGQMYNWIRISWTGVADASSYVLQEDTTDAFTNPLDVTPLWAQTENTLYNRVPGTYYYRVKAVNSLGSSAWRNGSNPCVVVAMTSAAVVATNSGMPAFRDVRPDALDVVALVLDVKADPVRSVEIRSLTLSASGSADDCSGIAMLRLYRDADGDGVWNEDADALLKSSGGFAADNGTALFSGLDRFLPAGASEVWFVVADFTGSGQEHEDFSISVAYTYPASVTAVDFETGLPIPVNGPPATGTKMTVYGSDTPGSLTVSASPFAPQDEEADAGGCMVMAAFALAAGDREAVSLTGISFKASGSGDDSAHVASLRLAEDKNCDGLFTPGIDRVIGSPQTFNADDGTASFGASGETISPNQSMSLLLVCDFASSAPAGSTFKAEMAAGSVQASGMTTAMQIPVDGLPYAGRTVTIADQGGGSDGRCGVPAVAGGVDSFGAALPFALLAAAMAIAAAFRRR